MVIPEGVYCLTNVHTQDGLGLGTEWWYFCSVKDKQAARGDGPDEQWLVARPPGASDDVRVMVNLLTGGYAGVWKNVWGRVNDDVKCTPSPLRAANIQWMVTQLSSDQTKYTFHRAAEPVTILACDGPGRNVKAMKPRSEDSRSVHWYSKTVESVEFLWPNWMDRLPDDIMLADINIPCTHQSLASHGIASIRPDMGWGYLGDGQFRPWIKLPRYIDNPRCQNLSLWDQLLCGIRGFDVRLDLDRVSTQQRQTDGSMKEGHGYFLYARHGMRSER
nr:hypothetical protein CFP56_09814 [Quercus suber]